MKFSYEKVKDPAYFKEHCLPAHAEFTAYESLQDQREDRRTLYASLNGIWKMAYAENLKSPLLDGYEKMETDCSEWAEIHVPGHIQLQGYDRPQYVNVQYPWDGREEIAPGEIPERFNPTACYVKYFEVPEQMKGRPVLISFQGVESGMILYLNGRYVGYSEDSFTPSEFDLTPYLREGINKLAVTVIKWTSGSWCEDQDFFRFSGIYRDVFLYTRPECYLEDFTVRTDLAEDYKKANVMVTVKGRFDQIQAQFRQEGQVIAEEECAAEGGVAGHVSLRIKEPRLWSAEDPYLYELLLYVKDRGGRVHEVIPQAVGVRKVEIRDSLILLNGRRIEFKGVNRHDFSSRHGRAVTEQETLLDVVTMKQNNINAIRTSHYPDNTPLYHMCDTYGLYLLAENNMETHGTWARAGGGQADRSSILPGSHMEWLPMLLDRVRSCYERDKNHPSVLIWSCGNESHGGPVICKMAEEFRRLDPTRPVHYEGVFQDRSYNETSDMESQMYPSAADIAAFLKEHREKPFICCEYAHAMGNSCGGMFLYTDLMEQEPLYQGGFLWDYIDQSIGTVNRYGEWFEGYGGDFDDRPTDYEFSGNGIVYGSDRTPTPKMAAVKYNYQNIKIEMEQGKKPVSVRIRNRHLFLSTGCFCGRMEVRKNGTILLQKELSADIGPMSEAEVALPLPKLPDGAEYAVIVSFHLKEDALWAKAGHEVAFGECIFTQEAEAMPERIFWHQTLAGCKAAKESRPEVVHGAMNLGVRGTHFTALFSALQGGLVSYVYDGREMIATMPRPNFFRAPTSNDIGSLMPQRYAQWKIASEYNTFHRLDENMSRDWTEQADYQVEETGDSVKISYIYYMPTVPASQCRMSYEVFGDGTIRTLLTYDPVPELGDMPEFGVLLRMKAEYDRMQWYGMGPGETYIDRMQGARLGIYESSVRDNMARYLVPQECGNRTGVRYAKVMDAFGHGLLFTGDGMHFSALPYLPQELEAARHAYELPPVHYTVIRASLSQMGVAGDDSWGARTLEQFLLDTSGPMSFCFTMKGI
nr:glycoside hydrolase family 2 TIM barrel-domain containing protein [uncultured Oscillibacter sp.]